MNFKNRKRNPNALGKDCSCYQRILQDELHPENNSQEDNECTCESDVQYLDMKNLPEDIMQSIIDKGLEDKWKSMPKMLFSVCKKGDPCEHVINYITRYGKLPGVAPMMKSIHVH